MKRFLALLFTFVLLFCMIFVSCDKQTSTDDEKDGITNSDNLNTGEIVTEISTPEAIPEYIPDLDGREVRIMAWWIPGPTQRGVSELGDLRATKHEEMEKKYNFKFGYINEPLGSGDYFNMYTASVLSNDPVAEFVWVQVGMFFPSLVVNNFLYPVSDLPEFDFTDSKWNQLVLDFATYKNKIYGFGTGRPTPRGLIFWNKTMFERKGFLDMYKLQANKQWTWDKFVEVGIGCTDDIDNDGNNDFFGVVNRDLILEQSTIFSNNGSTVIFDENNYPKLVMDDANTMEALQFIQDLHQKHKIVDMLPTSGNRYQYGIERFRDGHDGMLTGEMWMTEQLATGMTDDYGIVMFPMGPKADDYVSVAGDVVFVTMPSNAAKPEELAFIWDIYTDPLPEEEADQDAWRRGYENSVRDEESLESINLIQTDGRSILDNMVLFGSIGWNAINYYRRIEDGSSTPANVIEEFMAFGQNVIDDAMSQETN